MAKTPHWVNIFRLTPNWTITQGSSLCTHYNRQTDSDQE